jgi:hypothetical protein
MGGRALILQPQATSLRERCLPQEHHESAIVIHQLLEAHPVEARGRWHDHVSHARYYGLGLLHSPANLRSRPKPFGAADTYVGDGQAVEALQLLLQFGGPGPYLLPRQLVGPAGRPGAQVGMSTKRQNEPS